MKTVSGYKILLIDDTIIEGIPNRNGLFEFEIDDFLIIINNGNVSIKGDLTTSKFIPDIISIEAAEIKQPTPEELAQDRTVEGKDEAGAMARRWTSCESRSYCITNGCARTPCGTICDM